MPETVKLPGIGPVKKGYAIAGVGIAGGILIYAYWRRTKAKAADATTPTDAGSTPSAAIDPSTGLPYSQESGGSGVGYGQPNYGGYGGGSYGNNGSYCPYGTDMYGNCLAAPTGAKAYGAYTNNSDWAAAAEDALTNTGITLATASTAITRVLGGLSVTSAQKAIFLQAIGLLGQPPQGYPTPIHVLDDGSGPPPPSGSGSLSAPGQPTITAIDQHGATVSWTAPSSGTVDHYVLYRRDGSGGNVLAGQTRSTSYRIGYFKPHTSHTVWVNAVDSRGHRGPASAATTFTTHR